MRLCLISCTIAVLIGCSGDATVVIKEQDPFDSGMDVVDRDASSVTIMDAHFPFDGHIIPLIEGGGYQPPIQKCLRFDSCPKCPTPWYESIDSDGGATVYQCPPNTYCHDDTLNQTIQCF